MPSREVLVTYTLYPSGNGDLHTALAGLKAQFPLRNLHWKSSTRTALRTIQEADVTLLDLGDLPPPKDQVAGSVLDVPLVNICLVSCDDAELYKNNTRTFIKDWLALLQSRRSTSTPMIVLVNPASTATASQSSKNVFGRDKGIIAKLKADFNTQKRDICAQINLPPLGTTDPAAWPEVINKLKESIVASFDVAICEREDEVKRGEAQRVTVGWNFCTWFLLKESLAHSFEGVHLYEDALLVYEELEATFLQVQKEQNLSWFGKLGATGPKDDSLSILDATAKPYRELLISSDISIFDFRIYVFARQCVLLGKIGRITEIARRGQWFVASLAQRLRESQTDLPEYFIESWTYTACLDLVAHCDEWSRQDRPNNDYSGLIAYESARSELLDIARIQIERIGVASGLLPNEYPFQPITALMSAEEDVIFESSETGSDAGEGDPGPPRPVISNATIVAALNDKETYLSLYEDMTTQALEAYQACGKGNSIVRLKADLASVALHAEQHSAAYDLFRSLSRDCAELHVWDRVAQFALHGALVSHRHLEFPRDDDWAHLAIAYLRACTMDFGAAGDDELLGDVVAGLKELPEPRQEMDSPVFRIRVLDDAATISDDVTITQLRVEVENKLPLEVEVKDVWLDLDSSSFGTVTYSSGPVALSTGKQAVTLSCSTSVSSPATLREGFVALGQVGFVTQFPQDQIMVPIRRNRRGLRTVLRMPDTIALDEEPRVVLEIHSGEQPLKKVQVVVASMVEEVGYRLDKATSEGRKLVTTSDSVEIGDVEEQNTILISIPYRGVPRNEVANAQIVVQYNNASSQLCTYIDEQTVFMGLPITVNVQDFFRPDVLVSSFSIASDGREYVRVGKVALATSSEAFEIEPCRGQWDHPPLVAPNIPLSCLFRVRHRGKEIHAGETLQLQIEYQTVAEGKSHRLLGLPPEITLLSEAALGSFPNSALARAVRKQVADRSRWLQRYLLADDVAAVFDKEWLSSMPSSVPAAAVDDFLASLEPAAPRWRTLRIPVEIPLRRLLTSVRLTPTSPTSSVYEGRALTFDLDLTTSFAWLGEAEKQAFRVTYDLTANAEDWVVVGKKRGIYTADPSQRETQQVVLVPVRHGSLALPPVSVQLVADGQTPQYIVCETYVANAAQGIKVLPSRTGMAALVPVAPNWEE